MRTLLLLLLALVATPALAAEADIYIVAGQSNGWRLSALGALPGEDPHAVHYFGMDCTSRPDTAKHQRIARLHPKVSGAGLAAALLERAGRDIVFVQYCVCGSSLNDVANWQPGEDPLHGKANHAGLYGSFTRYMADVRRQLAALGIEGKVKGLFWHQGEADVKIASDRHRSNLERLFARFRHDFGADLPIVAGHIRSLDEGSRGINRALDAVDAADAHMKVVPLEALEYESPTDVHIKPPGCILLGQRMADALAGIR